MIIKRILVLFYVLVIPFSGISQAHYPGQHHGKLAIPDKVNTQIKSFDLSKIKLLDSPFLENMKRESDWILSLGTDRLLHSFRTNAGVFSGQAGFYYTNRRLEGWESLDCELRGHSAGHILSGLALLFASTGEEIYKIKADSLINGLEVVQQALNQDGYLSAFPQNLIDRNIKGQQVWAPWYTLHKIMSGLIDQYLYCDSHKALNIAENMASWAYGKLSPLSPRDRQVMLKNEFGGINDSFFNLYAITGNPEHKFLAEFFYHEIVLDPLLKRQDILNKKHANTYIPKIVGITRGYELNGNEKLKSIADFFWNTVVNHHTFITGSNSDKEIFFEPDQISKHLSGYTGESCNVFNMLKLTRHLYTYNPDVKYVDYYEKALYNHILGQQDPNSGMISYFLPLLPGAHKIYSTSDKSFWCCVGTGFENHVKYGEFIYSYTTDELFVNLFIPSELSWKKKGFRIRQDTNFPEEEIINLVIQEAPVEKIKLKIRYPSWATSGVSIKINGEKENIKQSPGSYISLLKKWEVGDSIQIFFPMEIKMNPTPDDMNIVAFTYGPIVLAGKMGTQGMKMPAPFSNPDLHNDFASYDFNVPDEISNKLHLDKNNVSKYIIPLKGNNKLTFKILNEGIIMEPIYKVHHERYIVYWEVE